MKYIVLLGDGMAGDPLAELGGRTTLEAARTEEMDRLAKSAELGTVCMVPEHMAPGSDTANLSVLGYDPEQYYTGRSPLEALSIGAVLGDTDTATRCNLVTLLDPSGEEAAGEVPFEERIIVDHSAGEISTEDADILLQAVQDVFQKEGITGEDCCFYTGTSYRHLFVQKNGTVTELVPPHDVLGQRIGPYLPEDVLLRKMMEVSFSVLDHHPLNEKRAREGLHKANSFWFWGTGTKPALPSFAERTGKKGVMISAVDLLKGIAAGSGMTSVHVEGATGGLHTNYEGKAEAAIKALLKDGYDFAYIHVEAPDEMGHQGRIEEKIQAIEWIDQKILKKLTDALDKSGEHYRILILPDHKTPIRARTHTKDAVPYLLYDNRRQVDGADCYNEKTAEASGTAWADKGCRLIRHLLED